MDRKGDDKSIPEAFGIEPGSQPKMGLSYKAMRRLLEGLILSRYSSPSTNWVIFRIRGSMP